MEPGQVIAGRYRLRERLGQGGMSVVWRADDDVLGREVAVKVLSAALAGDADQRRQIHAEARAAARLRHVNVVAVYDYGEFTDRGRTLAYVVMELADGRTLADMLTGGRLPWKVAVLVGAQVAAALAAAHADGVVHRDVKPANVMVTSGGVKLVDFGISAAVGALDGQGGILQGTPAYLAPERIEGGPVRPATDVYALGLLMYVALAGQMPWQASTVTQMVKAHVYAKPAPLPPVAGLPPAVARLVARCLAKKPADRPSSIEIAESLGEIGGLPSSALLRSMAAPTVAMPVPVRPRRRGVLIAAGVMAVTLAGSTAWWAGGRAAPPAEAAAVVAPSSPAVTSSPSPRPSTVAPAPVVRTIPVTQHRKVAKRPPKAAPARPAAPKPKKAAKRPAPKKPAAHPAPKKPGK